MKGIVCIWSGAIVDIPAGWVLCDGNNNTPDLRDLFVVGAGSLYDPDDTGGTVDHTHTFTSNSHSHNIPYGAEINAGAQYDHTTTSETVSGTTDAEDNLPPYHALAYIMKT